MAELFKERVPEADDLEALLESGDDKALKSFFMLLHPADMALLFNTLDKPELNKSSSQVLFHIVCFEIHISLKVIGEEPQSKLKGNEAYCLVKVLIVSR